ncbi:Uncharacterised protein [Mycobacteroides abscessus subsp. abscessus]|nr:Uncharacterised protein [Mycobacteroides abscessus subsp. abscessus]
MALRVAAMDNPVIAWARNGMSTAAVMAPSMTACSMMVTLMASMRSRMPNIRLVIAVSSRPSRRMTCMISGLLSNMSNRRVNTVRRCSSKSLAFPSRSLVSFTAATVRWK